MTELQLFAFFGVPILAAGFGLLVYFFEGRRQIYRREPDLFDDKKPMRTPGE